MWSSPSGYFSPSYRTAFVEYAVGRRPNPRGAAFEDQIENQQNFGTTNIRKIYVRENLNITGGSFTVNYVPVAESTPMSAGAETLRTSGMMWLPPCTTCTVESVQLETRMFPLLSTSTPS